jgi:hypothetical protein
MGVLIEDGRRNLRKPGIPAASIDEELKMGRGNEESNGRGKYTAARYCGSGVNTIWGRGTSVSPFFSKSSNLGRSRAEETRIRCDFD